MAAIKPDQVIDVKGLQCPRPLLKTRQTLESMASGNILEVIATDPSTKSTISSYVKNSGDLLLDMTENSGEFRFYIKKK